MLKIEQQADLSAKRESLKKLSLLCHSISGLTNVYTIFIYRKRTSFSEKRPYYWLGYGLHWLCGTTILFVMRVYDYIPLMSPVTRSDFLLYRLRSIKLVIIPFLRHQLIVRSRFGYSLVGNVHDPVAATYRGKTVRDYKRRSAAHQVIKAML